jgi:mono/diheme cytochrome c family protein
MKRYGIALTVALLMLALLALPRSQAQEKPKGDAVAGKMLYIKSCKKCHGELGEGVPKMYRLVKAPLVHLGSKQAQDKSDAEIRKSMTDGFGKMQPIKDPRPLTPEELDNIVAFTRTLKQ